MCRCVSRYIDRTMYLKTQPPDTRKKGFMSSDARRRDEFTLDTEVQKWRERIGLEMEVRLSRPALHLTWEAA